MKDSPKRKRGFPNRLRSGLPLFTFRFSLLAFNFLKPPRRSTALTGAPPTEGNFAQL
jgi:hypothetical protein